MLRNYCFLDSLEKLKEVIVDDVVTDFMECSNCHRILKCKAANGITTMKRHLEVSCSASADKNKRKTEDYSKNRNERFSRIAGMGQTKMTSFAHKVVPPAEIANLNREIAIGLAKDLRPFKTVEGEGFSRIAKALIAFGAAHGNHDPRKVIHHRTHLRKQILPTIVEQQKTILSKCSQTAPSYPVFAF